jgi:CO/xanthine dehydrogenase Mo-binding subunit
MEEIQLKDGEIANASFTDYLLPTTLDMPKVEVELVEEPEPGTPFGAKGVGEPSNVVAPAAIVSALRNALGRELPRIPVRPDDLVGLREPVGIPPRPPFPERPSREPSPASAGIPRTGEP